MRLGFFLRDDAARELFETVEGFGNPTTNLVPFIARLIEQIGGGANAVEIGCFGPVVLTRLGERTITALVLASRLQRLDLP